MDREVPNLSDYVTYEVTVPRGAGAEIAVHSLKRVFGATIRERPALASDVAAGLGVESQKLTDGYFLNASLKLWGNTDYGAAAVQRLNDIGQGHDYAGDKHVYSDGTIGGYHVDEALDTLQGVTTAGVPFLRRRNFSEHHPTTHHLSDASMRERARLLWDQYHLPYEPLIAAPPDDTLEQKYNAKVLYVKRGNVTRERLADYIRTNVLHEHALHGTYGKMLDTMSVAAGVISKEDIGDREATGRFIDLQKLDGMMQKAGLSTGHRGKFRHRVAREVSQQLQTGTPFEFGEIIFEGRPPAQLCERWDSGQIATSSLAALGHSFTSRSETADFLLRIAKATKAAGRPAVDSAANLRYTRKQ